ncbi:MAG: hypothetical protein PHU25_17500 [Deltaproteobacteria bacterium]|nr:hypothetical protein [Deltaproteobacteria bacterium]
MKKKRVGVLLLALAAGCQGLKMPDRPDASGSADADSDGDTDTLTDTDTGSDSDGDTDSNALSGASMTIVMTTCTQGCLMSPDLAKCVADCAADETGVSAPCAACFGQFAGCTAQHCATPCLNPVSAACSECQQTAGCTPGLTTCSGISL